MKRGIYIFVVISLLLGLMAMVGCTTSKEGMPGNSPETGSFSTVVQMNGKELTVGVPEIRLQGSAGSPSTIVSVIIKNTGSGPINIAELEIIAQDSNGLALNFSEYIKTSVVVKALSPGDSQTLYWQVCLDSGWGDLENSGSFKVKVKRLE